MKPLFSSEKILRSALSDDDNYCLGYSHPGGYLNALVMGVGVFKETFSHEGSKVLDETIAYDLAEINQAYIGQINMITVSSFIGPRGLIWGYDLAQGGNLEPPPYLSKKLLSNKEFSGVKIRNGNDLRKASAALFGTRDKKHFPFLPGSHVPCASKWQYAHGPTGVYAAIAIGIPEDRSQDACLIMEDVGQISFNGLTQKAKQQIVLNTIQSVREIGQNQKIFYKEIFVDFIAEKIGAKEIGCALVAMPYFKLARKAYHPKLSSLSLQKWLKTHE